MTNNRELVAACDAGLCNRLRVLLSAMALSEMSGRTLRMVWLPNGACGARFDELFVNQWPVEGRDLCTGYPRYYFGDYWEGGVRINGNLIDVLSLPDTRAQVHSYVWLCSPHLNAANQQVLHRAHSLASELQPIERLAKAIERFKSAFWRPRMIGVHVRRGDFEGETGRKWPRSYDYCKAIDLMLQGDSSTGIFVATDDGAQEGASVPVDLRENVYERLCARYGKRVMKYEARSLARRQREAIEDAVIELMLLRSTSGVVGTSWSSFSELAVVGRRCGAIMVRGRESIPTKAQSSLAGRRLRAAIRRGGAR